MADGGSLVGLSQRLPPSNLQAEQALLGALLARNQSYEMVADLLEGKHFADPVHARIYLRIAERILDGHLADAVSMKADFENSGVLDEAGGTPYLAQLLSSLVSVNVVREYARAIVDCWIRRQLIDVGEAIVNNAFGGDPSSDGIAQIAGAERALAGIGGAGRQGSRLVTGGEAVRIAIEMAEQRHRTGATGGIVTGSPSIDAAFAAAGPGTLTLLGGLQSSGKTALVGQMVKAIGLRVYDAGIARGLTPEQAERQPGAAMFSLEASAEEVGLRMVAHEAGLNGADLNAGKIDMLAANQLRIAESRTRHMAVRIHDATATPWRLLAPKIVMHLQRQPELVVFIDHLLVLGDDEDSRGKGRGGLDAASVGQVTKNLKAMAKRLGVPFVVLTHIPRPLRDGVARRPTLWDVKWAGEGDADNVIFLHRPIQLMSDTPPPRGRMVESAYHAPDGPLNRWHLERAAMAEVAELVVAKIRGGPPAVHRLRWHGPTTSLQEINEAPAAHADDVPDWVL